MSSLIRPPLLAVAALLLVLGGGSLYLASARADDATTAADKDHKPTKRQVRDASKQAQKTAGARPSITPRSLRISTSHPSGISHFVFTTLAKPDRLGSIVCE